MSFINLNIEKAQLLIEEFDLNKCVIIPSLIDEIVLKKVIPDSENIDFRDKLESDNDGKFGKILAIPYNETALKKFNFIFNSMELFRYLELISGCAKIDNFTGRIHKSESSCGHYIDWHGDNSDNRMIAMTICLSTTKYKGGHFQLRYKNDTTNLLDIGQLNFGDAILFKISPDLEHRLTEVTEGERLVGVGWFRQKNE